MKHKNILLNISKRLIVLFLATTFMFINILEVSYASEHITIPDKIVFNDYIKKMYYIEDENNEDLIYNAILDYKDRFIMYVDLDYVLGKVEEANVLNIYYLVNNEIHTAHYASEFREYDGGGGGATPDPGYTPGTDMGGENMAVDITENVQYVWDYLLAHGYTEIAAAGVIGNLLSESGCRPNNVQGSYRQPNQEQYNQEYTAKVDSGEISRQDFVRHGPGGGGYGIAQFTYHTYKEEIYDGAKQRGCSIADIGLQCDVMYNNTLGIKNTMNSYNSVFDAACCFLHNYEKPQNQSNAVENERAANARGVYFKMTGRHAPEVGGGNGDIDTLFFQGILPYEYRNMKYYGDTLCGRYKLRDTGAGPTAIAMVATNLVRLTEPDKVAEQTAEYMTSGGSKLGMLTDVSKFGLKATAIGKDTAKLYEALKAGKKAIAVTGSKEEGGVYGIFNRTADCNFIVLLGLDENGYIEVADPDGGNYNNLKQKDITFQILKGETVGGFYVYEPLNSSSISSNN